MNKETVRGPYPLEALIATAKEFSRKIIEDLGKMGSVMVLVGDGKDYKVVACLLQSEEDKDRFTTTLKYFLQEQCATMYVMAMEAWSCRNPNAVARAGGHVYNVPPDDREDVLSIIGVENTGRQRSIYSVIDNLPEGKRLRSWVELDPQEITGRMVLNSW